MNTSEAIKTIDIAIEEIQRLRQAALQSKREWIGLTDEEVKEAYCSVSGTEWAIGGMNDAGFFAELIEAKLKEKNSV